MRPPPFSFFFNDTATTEIYTLSLHDALPVSYWPANDAPARSSLVAEERTANRWSCRPASPAAACSRRAQVWSQSASAADVTTTPAGTGKPALARRARLAALVP